MHKYLILPTGNYCSFSRTFFVSRALKAEWVVKFVFTTWFFSFFMNVKAFFFKITFFFSNRELYQNIFISSLGTTSDHN